MNIFHFDAGLGYLQFCNLEVILLPTIQIIRSQIRPRPIDFESKKVENLFTVDMALGFNQSAGTIISTSTSFETQSRIH